MNCSDKFRTRMRAIRDATKVEAEEVDGRPRCRWAMCHQPLLGDGTCTRGHVQDDRLEYPGYPYEELDGLHCALHDLIQAQAFVGADPRVTEFNRLRDDWEALKVPPEEAYSRAWTAMQGVVDVFSEQGGWEDDPRLQVAMVALNIALPTPAAYTVEIDEYTDYQRLIGPDGTEVTLLTEPEDRWWDRDLKPVVELLNKLAAENTQLQQRQAAQETANAQLRQALAEQEAGAAALRAALEQVEWGSAHAAENQICPWCCTPESSWEDQYEHTPDCPRQLALAGNAGQAWLERLRVAEQALAQREALPLNAVVLPPEDARALADLLVVVHDKLEDAEGLIPPGGYTDTPDPDAAYAPHFVPESVLTALGAWTRKVRQGQAVRQAQQLLAAPEVARAVRRAKQVTVLTDRNGETQVLVRQKGRLVHYQMVAGALERLESAPYASSKATDTSEEREVRRIVAAGGWEHCPQCGEVYPLAGEHICAEVKQ